MSSFVDFDLDAEVSVSARMTAGMTALDFGSD